MTEATQVQLRQLTGVRLPPDLVERLDHFCQLQKLRPSRTRVIEVAIREFLDREEPQVQNKSQ